MRLRLALLRDQPGVGQLLQVERQRGAGDPQCFRHRAGRQPVRAGHDERAEHLQAHRLGQRGKRPDDVVVFHDSRILEVFVGCNLGGTLARVSNPASARHLPMFRASVTRVLKCWSAGRRAHPRRRDPVREWSADWSIAKGWPVRQAVEPAGAVVREGLRQTTS